MTRRIQGTIVTYAIADGVGRICLDDGEELRFSIRALQGVVPAVGVRVSIGAIEPYPLGGRRALDIKLADARAAYEKHRKEYEKAKSEVMRRDLGRRAQELQLPVTTLKKSLERGVSVPGNTPPPRPIRGRAQRRATTSTD